ncbi:YgjV family protein [Mesorhizobium caraganae]|uniref:YgjV family protein n=1 Tax=Mesorhizobium caraganae TaxID=483206 RepID=A0ABV1Z4P8_9HYPH
MNWIDLISWRDVIGYAGTGFTIMAYSMRRMLPLRVAAVLSSVALLVYAVLTGSGPIIVMELILLPINSYRLVELLKPLRNLEGPARRHAMVTSPVQKAPHR